MRKRRWFEHPSLYRVRMARLQSEKEQEELLTFRMDKIKKLSNKAMRTAHPGNRIFAVRKSVVIPYEDLMEIWNQADLAKWD